VSQVIDERGSLFGRYNLIDLAAVVMVVVLIPMAYVAYRVFRQPAPVITSITPSTMSVDSARRVRITGQHFRPFLSAFVAKTDDPYAIPGNFPETMRMQFMIETPTAVELVLPSVPPGTYDLYLYDEGRNVAHQASAFTLIPGARPKTPQPGDPVPDTATIDFTARFDVDNEITPLVKQDAVDLNKPDNDHPATTPAKLASVKKLSTGGSDVALRLGDGGRLAAVMSAPRTTIEAVIRLGVTQDHGVWVYAGQHIRPGEGFTFATADYLIRGLITRINAVNLKAPL